MFDHQSPKGHNISRNIPINMLYSNSQGSTAYCLQLWRKGNSEPYQHYLHFIQSCGFLFAPTLATYVLPNGEDDDGLKVAPGIDGVEAYFILMAVTYQTFIPMYLCLAFKHSGQKESDEDGVAKAKDNKDSFFFWILISVRFFCNNIYMNLEG